MRRLLLLAGFLCLPALWAQDPFEIHIYEYEPLKAGEYSLEAHLNWNAQGTTARQGSLLPMRHQTHLTLEPTFGVHETFAVGFMFLNAWQPGYSPQFAGWRVLPHFYAPERWHLPVKLGLVAEFSFQKTRYEENDRRVEIRPIIDREFARWQVVFNPVFERALHGPATRDGWHFEPGVLVRLKRPVFSPSVEYYGALGSVNVRPRAEPQVSQIFLGGDWRVTPVFSVNLGVGFDLSDAGPGAILKSRFEWDWRH